MTSKHKDKEKKDKKKDKKKKKEKEKKKKKKREAPETSSPAAAPPPETSSSTAIVAVDDDAAQDPNLIEVSQTEIDHLRREMQIQQATYMAEAKARITYQKGLANIMQAVSNRYGNTDIHLADDIVALGLQCEHAASEELAKAPPVPRSALESTSSTTEDPSQQQKQRSSASQRTTPPPPDYVDTGDAEADNMEEDVEDVDDDMSGHNADGEGAGDDDDDDDLD